VQPFDGGKWTVFLSGARPDLTMAAQRGGRPAAAGGSGGWFSGFDAAGTGPAAPAGLLGLVAGPAVAAGLPGLAAGIALAAAARRLSPPVVLAVGHVALVGLLADPTPTAVLVAEAGFGAYLATAAVDSTRLGVLAAGAFFVLAGLVTVAVGPLGVAGAAIALVVTLGLATYACYRYGLVRLGLVDATGGAEADAEAEAGTGAEAEAGTGAEAEAETRVEARAGAVDGGGGEPAP
jgi:hypothetical protein